jgi:hypothetical protein
MLWEGKCKGDEAFSNGNVSPTAQVRGATFTSREVFRSGLLGARSGVVTAAGAGRFAGDGLSGTWTFTAKGEKGAGTVPCTSGRITWKAAG